jgi:hypothetical protein
MGRFVPFEDVDAREDAFVPPEGQSPLEHISVPLEERRDPGWAFVLRSIARRRRFRDGRCQ